MSGNDIENQDAPPGGWPLPRSAYIHVPFCRHRCGYCNFSVIAGRDDLIERFLSAIDCELAGLGRPPIDTLFVGGGTPTRLSPDQLQRFLGCLHDRFQLADQVEWSVEANPEDINEEKLALLAQLGVNRVSLGVQSFDAEKLRLLERGHLPQQTEHVIRQTAQQIANVSIDLIFAAPGETIDLWYRDVATALGLPITHLSTYALTFEKGTSYWSRRSKGELRPQDEATEVDMYQHVRSATRTAGFEQYEISSFARPGHRCQHNLAYWQGSGWYAAGPGAARFVDGVRTTNHRSTTTWLRRMETGDSVVAESDPLTPLEYARERVAFGVRMIDGIDLLQLQQETGVDVRSKFRAAIDETIATGWLAADGDSLRLTDRGVLFADAVAAAFLG